MTAVARSAYPIMSEKGIDIHSEKFGEIKGWRPTRLVKDADEANDRVYDYIICTFKALPDLLPTSSVVAPFLDGPFKGTPERSPTIVLIQVRSPACRTVIDQVTRMESESRQTSRRSTHTCQSSLSSPGLA